MAREGEVVSRKEKILARLKSLGAEPKRSLGQNFLISDHVVEKILEAARAGPFSALVEVGPGLGAITEDLLTLDRQMAVIELDRKFAEFWCTRGLKVFEADALQLRWASLNLPPGSLLVSNLPYQISSSLVIERSLEPAGLARMVLMFQKEVAQRLTATPRTKEYGLLSVIAQVFWEIKKVVDAGPTSFFPPPNVSSRVLSFRRRSEIPVEKQAADFLSFVKASFSQRRKLLSRNLHGSYFGGKPDFLPHVERLLLAQGLSVTARAEELDPPTFIRLYQSAADGPRRG